MSKRIRRISRKIERDNELSPHLDSGCLDGPAILRYQHINGQQKQVRNHTQEVLCFLTLPEQFETSLSHLNQSTLDPKRCREMSRNIREIGEWAKHIKTRNRISHQERQFLQHLQANLPELCLKLHSQSQRAQDLCFSLVTLAHVQTGDSELPLLAALFVKTLDSAPHGLMIRACWALAKRGVGNQHHYCIAAKAGERILKHDPQSFPKLIAQKVSLIHSCSVLSQHIPLIQQLLCSLRNVHLNGIQLQQCLHAAVTHDLDREYWYERFQSLSNPLKKVKKKWPSSE